jgi:hypothetical protein
VSAISKVTGLAESQVVSLAGRIPTAAEATYVRRPGFYSAAQDETDCMLHIACACALGQYAFAFHLIELARLSFRQAGPLLDALQAQAESAAALRPPSSSPLRSWLRGHLPKVIVSMLQRLKAAVRACSKPRARRDQ